MILPLPLMDDRRIRCFQAGEWVSGIRVLDEVGDVFRFLRHFSMQFAEHEAVEMGFAAFGIRG